LVRARNLTGDVNGLFAMPWFGPASAECAADRERGHSADEGGLRAPGPAGGFDPFGPSQQFLKQRADLHARQLVPHAEMGTAAKGENGDWAWKGRRD
jgi:hypothetical protein